MNFFADQVKIRATEQIVSFGDGADERVFDRKKADIGLSHRETASKAAAKER